AILDGSIDEVDSEQLPIFNLAIPRSLPNVDAKILDPRRTYADAADWQSKAEKLSALFIENFIQYTDTDQGKELVAAGPVSS
ncbi:MAG: phosphoenolpyruvate carboxykinase (ATP), partial [Planctomycetota bacterium]